MAKQSKAKQSKAKFCAFFELVKQKLLLSSALNPPFTLVSGEENYITSRIKNQQSYNKKSAFTLVEISVSIMIIALLTGGVLLASDLVKSAELRNTAAQMEKYEQAMYDFQIKYSCTAGDCANASTLFANAIDGNGNGVIECINGTYNENIQLWNHLSQAEMIEGKYSIAAGQCWGIILGRTNPRTNLSSNVGFHYVKLSSGVWGLTKAVKGFQIGSFGTTNNWTDYLWGPGLTSKQAYNIDLKIDNGKPDTGKVIATDAREPSMINSNTTCVSGSGASQAYVLNSDTTGCNVYYNFYNN